jgi:non-specific serine/threonine protein kinase/serine/threonine-protein kinase
MSPEQAEMRREDVDTRTDVYALGVLLYELLTGARPFEFRETGFDEIRRMIREDEPSRPSTRFGGAGERAEEIAANRRIAAPTLRRRLRGDLDWITMKALEKEPARRFASPLELAADLGRHLANEPVMASPPGRRYRLGKFVRKHRVGASFATILLVFLIGFGVTMALLAGRIADERDRANDEALRARRQARTAMQVQEVLLRLLQLVDKNQARGQNWSVPEMLFWARNAIDRTVEDEPVVRARVMLLLGQIYNNLGYEEGLELMRESLAELEVALGEDPSLDVETLHVLAQRDSRMGHLQEAELLTRYVVEARRRDLGDDHPETLNAVADLARVYMMQDRFGEAETLLSDALFTSRDKLGEDHPQTLKATGYFATAHVHGSRPDEAEALLEPALDRMRRVLGNGHLVTQAAVYDLARVKVLRDDRPAAYAFLREVVDAGFIYSWTGKDGRAFHDREAMLADPILLPLHGEPEFETILGRDSWGAAIVQAEERVRAGDRDGAIRFLRLAIERGCKVTRRVEFNPKLSALHGDPGFAAIVAELKSLEH